MPQATIRMNVENITANDVALNISFNITNPNAFDIDLSTISVTATNENGTRLFTLNLSGVSIPAHAQNTITEHEAIGLQAPLTDTITTTLSTTATARFFGLITKQLPVTVHLITSGLDIINTINAPAIHIDARLHTLTKTGVVLSGIIEITNNDSIDFTVKNITVSVHNASGYSIGDTVMFFGGVATGHSTLQIPFDIVVNYTIFDIQEIRILFQANVGATIAGFSKTLPVSAELSLPVPSLQELLNSDVPIEISLYGTFNLRLTGVLVNISFEIQNPYVIDLYTNDLTVKVWRVDKNTSRLMGEVPLQTVQIVHERDQLQLRPTHHPLREAAPHRIRPPPADLLRTRPPREFLPRRYQPKSAVISQRIPQPTPATKNNNDTIASDTRH